MQRGRIRGKTAGYTLLGLLVAPASAAGQAPSLDPISPPPPLLEDAPLQRLRLTGLPEGPRVQVTARSSSRRLLPDPDVELKSGGVAELRYLVAPDMHGEAWVQLTVRTATASLRTRFPVRVQSVNDPPSARAPPALSVPEDSGPQVIDVLDISPGPSNEWAQRVTLTATLSPPGPFTLDRIRRPGRARAHLELSLRPDAHGQQRLSLRLDDGGGVDRGGRPVTELQVELEVTPVPDPPEAQGERLTATEDLPLELIAPGVLSNDRDADGDRLVASLIDPPLHGVLWLNPDGSLLYLPRPDFSGPDRFSYEVIDETGRAALAWAEIDVRGSNDPPLSKPDRFTLAEDSALRGGSVLDNDRDIDGDRLEAQVVAPPAHGQLRFNADGTFEYRPERDYNGEDAFTYRAFDGVAQSEVMQVGLTVTPVNDAPRAKQDSLTVQEDGVLRLSVEALANDTDVDGDALGLRVVRAPYRSQIEAGSGSEILLRPERDFNGIDNLVYRARDAVLESADTWVKITVLPVNDAPVAQPNRYLLDEDHELVVGAPGPLGNDRDIEGDRLSAELRRGPRHGEAELGPDGALRYRPAPNFHGEDELIYAAKDQEVASATVTVTFTVRPVNDPPDAVPDGFAIDEDQTLNVGAPGVLDNDSDLEGGRLMARLELPPQHGALTLNENGSFVYVPQADFAGMDRFAYRAHDGAAASEPVLVVLEVRPVNDAPVAVADRLELDEDTRLELPAPGLLDNDRDVDGDPVTLIQDTTTENGVLTLAADGALRYTPNAQFYGLDTFSYHLSDGALDSPSVQVSIEVKAVNDPPMAVGERFGLEEDQTLEVAAPGLLGNDSDVEGDRLRAVLARAPAHGEVEIEASGAFVYRPDADFFGGDSFEYEAVDEGGATGRATVDVQVRSVNDPPRLDALPPIRDMFEDGGERRVPLAGLAPGPDNEWEQGLYVDARSDNPALIPDPVVAPLTPGGAELIVAPLADQYGRARITVEVTDDGSPETGGPARLVRTFDVRVQGVNDPPVFEPPELPTKVSDDAPTQQIVITGVLPGPMNELDQRVSVSARSNAPGIIPDPTFRLNEHVLTLRFKPARHRSGSALLSVVLRDDGGRRNEGRDTTRIQIPIEVELGDDPPSVPIPLTPRSRSVLRPGPVQLVWEPARDRESSSVRYELEIERDERRFASLRSDTPSLELSVEAGVYRWRVRAVDEAGQASHYSPSLSFSVLPTQTDEPPGCGCGSAGERWPALGLLALLLWRRRRGSSSVRPR